MLRWRPLVALFVNECTLLPMLVPLGPARTVLQRIPDAVADLLAAHHVPREVIDGEVTHMAALRVAPTGNRSVVGIMNEFGFLADALSDDGVGDLLSACRCGWRRRHAGRCTGGTSVLTVSSLRSSHSTPVGERPRLHPSMRPRHHRICRNA